MWLPNICRKQWGEKWEGGEVREELSMWCCRDKHGYTLYFWCTDVVVASILFILQMFCRMCCFTCSDDECTGTDTAEQQKGQKAPFMETFHAALFHTSLHWIGFMSNLVWVPECFYSNMGWVVTRELFKAWRKRAVTSLFEMQQAWSGKILFCQNAWLLLNGRQWRKMYFAPGRCSFNMNQLGLTGACEPVILKHI